MLSKKYSCNVCKLKNIDKKAICITKHAIERFSERFNLPSFKALRSILRVCLYGDLRLNTSRDLWYATDFNMVVSGKIDGKCFVVCTVYYFPLFNEKEKMLRLPSMKLDNDLLVKSPFGMFNVVKGFSGFTLKPLRRIHRRKVFASC